MILDEMPKPTDLMENPQLAPLVVLETALVASMRALLAQHTKLFDDEYPRTMTEADTWADRIIFVGHSLVVALRKYRDLLAYDGDPSDDVEF
jgi:hypothetical protein